MPLELEFDDGDDEEVPDETMPALEAEGWPFEGDEVEPCWYAI